MTFKKQLLLSITLLVILFSACKNGEKNDGEGSSTGKVQETNRFDVIVYGGTSAGVIAAVSAARMGKTVLLLEPQKHFGGMTASGLGETDIGDKYTIEGLSRDFYRRVGKEYGKFEGWKFEPKAAEKVFMDYLNEGGIDYRTDYWLEEAVKLGDTIDHICVKRLDKPGAKTECFFGKIYIDCTYEGDLMAKAGVSYTIGREGNAKYNETLNGVHYSHGNQIPDGIDPYNTRGDSTSGLIWGISEEKVKPEGAADKKVQAYCYRLCMTSDPKNSVPVTKPETYDPKKFEILRRIIQKRDSAGWKQVLGQLYMRVMHMPNNKTDMNNKGGMSLDFIGASDDYPEAGWEKRKQIEKEHIQYTKEFLWFLGNDPHVPEHLREQVKKWAWPKDEFTDNNHFPWQIYVREGRRMIGEYVMTEHNCRRKEIVKDGVAFGAYNMDSHHCDRHVIKGMAKNEGEMQVPVPTPYPISYRSITPKRAECSNLLVPVSLSASHASFGSIRMEPVFMMLGQAAGMAASMAIDAKRKVQEIDVAALQEKQKTDPLLNGTSPDFVIDNDIDTTLISYNGGWATMDGYHVEPNYSTLLYKPAGKTGTVVFTFHPKKTGKYKAYYFCPGKVNRKEGYKNAPAYVESLPVIVAHENGKTTEKISLKEYAKNWAPMGEYSFEDGKEYAVTVDCQSVKEPAAADAVMFILQK